MCAIAVARLPGRAAKGSRRFANSRSAATLAAASTTIHSEAPPASAQPTVLRCPASHDRAQSARPQAKAMVNPI